MSTTLPLNSTSKYKTAQKVVPSAFFHDSPKIYRVIGQTGFGRSWQLA